METDPQSMADKSAMVLVNLQRHLEEVFPNLSATLPLSQIRNDTAGNISMVMPLRMRSEPVTASLRGYMNLGLPLDSPTFMLQFTPMTIESEIPPVLKTLFSVTVATYHGVVLKKDYLTLYIDNSINDVDEAELRSSDCELLAKLESYEAGFRLCSGIDNSSNRAVAMDEVFVEPFGESRDLVIIRSRKCEFMLDLEDFVLSSELDLTEFPRQKLDPDRLCCRHCGILQNELVCQVKLEPLLGGGNETVQVDEESDEHDILAYVDDKNDDPDFHMNIRQSPKAAAKIQMYNCDHCSRQFKYEQALMRHKERVEREKHKCDKCDKGFMNEKYLKNHMEKCKGPSADTEIRRVSTRKRKKKSVLMTKPRRKRGSNKKSISSSKTEADKTCPLCLRSFNSSARFDHHMERHQSRIDQFDQEVTCPLQDCGQVLQDRLKMVEHYTESHDSNSVPCAYCLAIFPKNKIRFHLANVHPPTRHPCGLCDKVFPFQSHLKMHTLETHSETKARNVVCEICGNQYRREAGLKQHMAAAHSKQRDYQCVQCQKGFTTHTKLTQHLRIHTGSKPYKCKLCEYRANRADNVLYHCKKVHKVERPNRNEDIQIFNELLSEEVRPLPIKLMQVDEQTFEGVLVATD